MSVAEKLRRSGEASVNAAEKLAAKRDEALVSDCFHLRRSAAKCGEIKERSKEKRAGAPACAGAGARSKPRANWSIR